MQSLHPQPARKKSNVKMLRTLAGASVQRWTVKIRIWPPKRLRRALNRPVYWGHCVALEVKMPFARSAILAALVSTVLADCASNGVEPPQANFVPASDATASTTTEGNYTLSSDERDFDCKRLTGKVQIRILELRTFASRSRTSMLSRTLQSATTPIFGGTTSGINPTSDEARTLAQAEAYNRELDQKGCRSFDLVKAIASTETPPVASIEPAVRGGQNLSVNQSK